MDVLSDDLVQKIVAMLPEESGFVVLVCKRLRDADAATNSQSGHVCTPLRRIFASTSRIRAAMQSGCELRKLCCINDSLQNDRLSWSTYATLSAFSEGGIDVLHAVRPSWMLERTSLHYICRYGRVDLLDHLFAVKQGPLFDKVSAMLSRMSTSKDKVCARAAARVEQEMDVQEFVEDVLLPASAGGAICVINWFVEGVRARQLRNSTLWDRVFDGTSTRLNAHVGRIVCKAANAKNAAEVIQLVVDRVVSTTKLPRARVCKEAALMVAASVGCALSTPTVPNPATHHPSPNSHPSDKGATARIRLLCVRVVACTRASSFEQEWSLAERSVLGSSTGRVARVAGWRVRHALRAALRVR